MVRKTLRPSSSDSEPELASQAESSQAKDPDMGLPFT